MLRKSSLQPASSRKDPPASLTPLNWMSPHAAAARTVQSTTCKRPVTARPRNESPLPARPQRHRVLPADRLPGPQYLSRLLRAQPEAADPQGAEPRSSGPGLWPQNSMPASTPRSRPDPTPQPPLFVQFHSRYVFPLATQFESLRRSQILKAPVSLLLKSIGLFPLRNRCGLTIAFAISQVCEYTKIECPERKSFFTGKGMDRAHSWSGSLHCPQKSRTSASCDWSGCVK